MEVRMTNLDLTDRCIIALLQVDGRLSHTEIARRLGIPEATVRRRMKRLVDERTIQIVAQPEPFKTGFGVRTIIGLRIKPGMVQEALAALRPLQQIRYIGVTTGTYDIVIETIFHDNKELRDFLLNTLGQTPGLVSTETSYLLDIAKWAYKIDLFSHEEHPELLNGMSDEADLLRRCRAAIRDLEGRASGHVEIEVE
jgi:Lrp/AsnC family transcriptional regulator for asnA, asnC and gidA